METKRPLFISFYSNNPYYIESASKLRNRCSILGIDLEIEMVGLYSEYWKNTLYKPSFILGKIREKKRDVIWIDADTDIKIYHDNFKKWETDILSASHTGELNGIKASPLGFKYNDRCISFLTDWSSLCRKKITENDIDLDHDVLKYEILPNYVGKIAISVMGGDFKSNDFSDGKVIMNGISRLPNKHLEIRKVIEKNESRKYLFDSLTLNNF